MPFRDRSLDPERKNALHAFQKKLGIRFRDLSLLNRALTHRSLTNEDAASSGNNERLEFLGDAVLGLAAAAYLYRTMDGKPEGDLARVKSFVVSEEALAAIAADLGMDTLILLGKGEERSGGRGKKAILADAMEAVFGAAFLDSGFEKARDLVLRFIAPEVDKVLTDRHRRDYKTLLQEYVQRWHRGYPEYALASKDGPDHDRTYWMTCTLLGVAYGPAAGKTKKDAEQAAAAMAYEAVMAAGGVEAERLVSMKRL